MNKKYIVISDFDGTITTRDALVEMLDNYVGPKWREIARLVKNGSMGTKVALRKEMDYELLSKMKKSGCSSLAYGVESGSPEVLSDMCKNTDLGEAKRILRDTYKAGMVHWPEVLLPQAMMEPLRSRARLWLAPAATNAIGCK